MANPQPNRHVRISTELFEAIYRTRLTARMLRIVLWVIRQSYGWNRKWAPVRSARRIGVEMDMDFSDVAKAVRGLIRSGVLRREGDRFYLNKDYEKWAVDTVDNLVDKNRGRITHVGESPTKPWANHPRTVGESPTRINKENKDTLKTERQKAPRAETARDPNVKLLIDEFRLALTRKLKEEPTGFNAGAAGNGFKKLLRSYPRHDIQSRFNAWFSSTDPHIDRRGWRVEDFFAYFNRLKDGPILKREERHERRVKDDGYATAKPGKYAD